MTEKLYNNVVVHYRDAAGAKGSWRVKRNGERVSRHHKKENAVDRARSTARGNRPAKLLIKDRNGATVNQHHYA